MTMRKYFVGWLLIWVADIILFVATARWGSWSYLSPLEESVRDILVLATAIGIFTIPPAAYDHLRKMRKVFFRLRKERERECYLAKRLPKEVRR